MKKIGIDVDGVIRDVSRSINKVFKTHYSEYITNEVPYNYDFPHIKMPLSDKFNIIFNEYPEDVFLKAKPYPGAATQFNCLKQWAKKKNIKIVCVTSQENHLISLTYLWLGKYDFTFDELYITKDKGNIGLDYLIDDAPYNYENWLKNGNPEQNFFLIDRDWNREILATHRITHISEIVDIVDIIIS